MTRIVIEHRYSQRPVRICRSRTHWSRRIPPVHTLRFRNALYPDTPHPYLHPLLAALVIAGVLLIVWILGYLQ